MIKPAHMDAKTKNYWVSWYDTRFGEWEYHGPWWITGYGEDEQKIICLAIQAETHLDAELAVYNAHDEQVGLEFRFAEEMPDDWNPLDNEGGRFPPADWMVWPMTNEENLKRVKRPA